MALRVSQLRSNVSNWKNECFVFSLNGEVGGPTPVHSGIYLPRAIKFLVVVDDACLLLNT